MTLSSDFPFIFVISFDKPDDSQKLEGILGLDTVLPFAVNTLVRHRVTVSPGGSLCYFSYFAFGTEPCYTGSTVWNKVIPPHAIFIDLHKAYIKFLGLSPWTSSVVMNQSPQLVRLEQQIRFPCQLILADLSFVWCTHWRTSTVLSKLLQETELANTCQISSLFVFRKWHVQMLFLNMCEAVHYHL